MVLPVIIAALGSFFSSAIPYAVSAATVGIAGYSAYNSNQTANRSLELQERGMALQQEAMHVRYGS